MATPARPKASPTLEARLEELGSRLGKLRSDMTLLVQGEMSKLGDVMSDHEDVLITLSDVSAGWVHPSIGDPERLEKAKTDARAEADQLFQMLAAEQPRFAECSAGGSLTEGSKIERLIQILMSLAPLIKLFL